MVRHLKIVALIREYVHIDPFALFPVGLGCFHSHLLQCLQLSWPNMIKISPSRYTHSQVSSKVINCYISFQSFQLWCTYPGNTSQVTGYLHNIDCDPAVQSSSLTQCLGVSKIFLVHWIGWKVIGRNRQEVYFIYSIFKRWVISILYAPWLQS